MAVLDPTPKRDGKGMTVWIEDASNSQVDVETDYLCRAFFKVHGDGFAAPGWRAMIFASGTPQGNSSYNNFPIDSIVIAAGNIYIKDAAGDNWGKVTIVT